MRALRRSIPTANAASRVAAPKDAEPPLSGVVMDDRMRNVGLTNLNNTCYVAAIVQLLLGQPIIAAALRRTVNATSSVVARSLFQLANVMSSMTEGTPLSPQQLVDTIHDADSQWVQRPYDAVRGEKQCADEFLQFLLVAVPELAPCLSFKERTLPSTTWLAGSTKLSVSLVHELDQVASLSALIHAQFAGADNVNKVEIGQLQSNLVVSVKRWVGTNGSISKDNTEFSISEPLDIFDKDGKCIGQFKLCGYVEHIGRGPKSGHYTTTSKRTMPNGTEAWLHFDDDKQPAPREEANVFSHGGRFAFLLLFTRIGEGGHEMPAELKQQVADVKEAICKAEASAAWEAASVDLMQKAHDLMRNFNLPALRNRLDAASFDGMRNICVQQIAEQMNCSTENASRAVQVAMDNPMPFQMITTNLRTDDELPMFELPMMSDLPMWSNRAQWKINPTIEQLRDGAQLVYKLVYELVGKHEIYRTLLSVHLDDTDLTVFIERPEQSGKTFTCVLVAWLSNICLGQAAYVLLRSGGQASEDYSKYQESVDALNRMIWQVMLGYTFEGPKGTGPFRKVDAWYEKRLFRGDLFTESAMSGFMQPFVLHAYNLHFDRTLASMDARQVLNNRWPLVFSRLCTPANLQRGKVHEMETIINAYGVDEYGFANVTLLNDEYQQNVKEGTRVQEEFHQPLAQNDTLLRVCASAANPGMPEAEALADMETRFKCWEERIFEPGGAGSAATRADFEQHAGGAEPDVDAVFTNTPMVQPHSRWDRSAYSACIKSHVRISATPLSGQVSSEDWDLRKGVVLELAVDSKYYGHKTSTGIDANHELRIEWRQSSNLIMLEAGDFPTLPSPPPRIQKFVMDEVQADIMREGYAHILLQTLGLNNSGLFDIARFLVAFADETVTEMGEHRAVIAITAYMHTTAGHYPGGPWLVFSQDALPLRDVIADVAKRLFVDADPKSLAPVPAGQIALRKGAEIAPGIQQLRHRHASDVTLNNALQLPKNSSLFLKNLLALVDGAIEQLNWDKSTIKIITIGAGLLKVGMTPKTPDHKMSVTLALLSASSAQVKNLSGEDVSQGLHGRTSGSRDGETDPYWNARCDDLPPRLVASGVYKDSLTTYKKILQRTKQAAKNRADNQTLISAMTSLDFDGFSDLPKGTKLWQGQTPALRKRRGQDGRLEETIEAICANSTGAGKWKQSRLEGFLEPGPDTDEMLAKFENMKEEHPELFDTIYPQYKMPGWNAKIWFKWRPQMPHYAATVIDANFISEQESDTRLTWRLRFDIKQDEDDAQVMDDAFLDPEMTEWSYEQPDEQPPAAPALMP